MSVTGERYSLTQQLADSWSKTSFDDIPTAVVDKVKDNILDTLAVALACVDTDEARRATAAMTTLAPQSSSGSSVWGMSYKLPPAQAALVNGTVTHSRDFDDGGGPGHAGSTVLPAVLAVGEAIGCDGRTLIEATIAGYDVGYRVLQALGGFAAATDRGWHTTGSMGSFAAAAGAAKCLGLEAEQFSHALGIAGSFTGGLWAFIEDSAMTKRLHPGKAGETGVDAALLARAGFTGPMRIFEAEWGGIYSTYNGGVATPEKALEALGKEFRVATSYIKPYACCRGSHAAIDVLLDLVRTRGLTAEDIAGIEIYAAETHMSMLAVEPVVTVFDAQFSLPYAAALALCGGTLTLAEFDPPRMDDPRIRRTYDKISMTADPTIGLEDGQRLEVTLLSGEHMTVRGVSPTDAKGSAANPMTHAEVATKAEVLLAPFGDDAAAQLIRVVENLEEMPDLSELLGALNDRAPHARSY
ncbi:MmgE/PrpD family protein [Mycobacterium colombiense]|uniref:MmgE/PrpD family protein n=1 Tax=Mycobacterium colombiense TaxID=339268 RepID=UPI00200B9CEB|nr:MmgE/PrpD family protein [Mycobacterium colombiense]MCK8647123.1 MmgE/PrpD family protein [Mycobacterium colombiense]